MKHRGGDLPTIYKDAIEEYRQARRKHLRLYPAVLETLRVIKARGCLIVGYTESMAFYTNYRLRNLELDGLVDFIYSPEDHVLPTGLLCEEIRRYPAERYELLHTIQRHTPKGMLKPNPGVLLDIIIDVGASKDDALYVGDSLLKDVTMAKQAGVLDVFAEYGTAQHRAEYELLRRVTHWTSAAVAEEKRITITHIEPTHTLENDFGEILQLAEFVRFRKA